VDWWQGLGMTATISANADGSFSASFRFFPGNSMLESEEALRAALYEAGNLATGKCLEHFDTDGAPISVGGERLTSKGKLPKIYQTPYGELELHRHVYQTCQGGETFCPLEVSARVVRSATPSFARQVALKLGLMNSTGALQDLAEGGRVIARSYLQDIATDVASVAMEKEEIWSYAALVAQGVEVKTIGIGVDGTCVLFCGGDYRQVMVGTIALYDAAGERLHTTYIAQAPERGKAAFYEKMERELSAITARFPQARKAAVADGARDHWAWLEERSTWQIVDFWHVSEYLSAAAPAMKRGRSEQEIWLAQACHRLKHESGAAASLQEEMGKTFDSAKGAGRQALEKAISYFRTHLPRMNYAVHVAMGLPIGSGVTEAACKSVVKERMSGSGMKWTSFGAQHILALRTLIKTEGRWPQFWSKLSRFGFCQIKGPHSKS
jgi:hypothetical protein